MAQADYDKWEPRYASGRRYGKALDPFLTGEAATYLPATGTAVDLAGGSGRHALWLARRGLDTTLVDIAPSALALAREQASLDGLELETLQWDLDGGVPEGPWDVAMVSFFLVRPLLADLHRAVAPGGVFVLVHPTARNLERHERPGRRWLFEDGEFTGLPGLRTELLREGWSDAGRHEVHYVGRRPPSSEG